MAATQARRKGRWQLKFIHQRSEKMKTLHPDPPYEKPIPHPKNRFMALTSNCTDMPTLFVDTHAPLDVLYDAANYRIRAVRRYWKTCRCAVRSSVSHSFLVILRCCAPFRCAMGVMCWM
jgi:hypothetical protein